MQLDLLALVLNKMSDFGFLNHAKMCELLRLLVLVLHFSNHHFSFSALVVLIQNFLVKSYYTLHCYIQLMIKLENFSFNRNSSNLLEHKFGNVKIRSKYIHSLNKFCQVVSMIQVVEQKSFWHKHELIESELLIN